MRAAVLGSPIGHSLSPVLHAAAYRALGLDWTYQAIDCDEHALAGMLARLEAEWGDDWAGLSLTMPLKRTVLSLLDEVSDLAAAVGGANTVVRRSRGGRGVLAGYNTDVAGMVTAVREAGVARPRSAVVIGAGATACAAVAAARDLGMNGVDVVARDPARAGALLEAARRLRVRVSLHEWDAFPALLDARRTDIVISTLPPGAADALGPSMAGGAVGATLLDVVYQPWPTALATSAAEAGWRVVGGFEMLLHQAARQVELMTGCPEAPVATMRRAGEQAVAERGSP